MTKEQLAVENMAAMRRLKVPSRARWFARLLVVIFFVAPVGLAIVPWQQSLSAEGRVIAFDPSERQQEIEAPVDGRILKWHVREGDKVRGPVFSSDGKIIKPGDTLVSLQDPDPALLARLQLQKQAIQERVEAAKDRIQSFSAQIESLKQSQEEALKAAKQRLKMGQKRKEASEQAVTVAKRTRDVANANFRMESKLMNDGLTSELTFLQAERQKDVAKAEELRAKLALLAAQEEVEALSADVAKVGNDASASISSAKASKQSAEAEVASAQRDLEDMKIRIARQETQEVTAPCDGTVFRILANCATGGSFVKSGERLLVLVPEIKGKRKRTVELFFDGNDAPQVMTYMMQTLQNPEAPDIDVRLQFEGWPAIQTIGWPNLARGTFPGKVVFVDQHDDGKGRFRVLVEPDADNPDVWPSEFELRQGARAKGWVLLNEVPLGYEMWRRFNGFPPVLDSKEKDGSRKKPEKVRVPK